MRMTCLSEASVVRAALSGLPRHALVACAPVAHLPVVRPLGDAMTGWCTQGSASFAVEVNGQAKQPRAIRSYPAEVVSS